jgi:predicted Fe-Mo cluster-binding NifX family protein
LKLALPTRGNQGLKDRVSEVFSKTPTFTILEWDGSPNLLDVIENPAASITQGAGPVATKLLKDKGIEVVLCGDIGIGVSTILSGYGIKHVKVKPGLKVSEAVSQIETLWNI